MSQYDLSFSHTSSTEEGSFKLLELPPELCTLIEDAIENAHPISLSIKGQPGEDAVLCTSDKTYSMRSVVLSNTVLVVTAPPAHLPDGEPNENVDGVVIRDQLNEIMELTPSVPKLHKLKGLLKGLEYDEGQDEEDEDMDDGDERKKFSYEDARAEIQASDAELDRGLRDMHVLTINGCLRPITPTYLCRILELILNALVSSSLSHKSAPVEEVISALSDDHEVPRQVSTQVMLWFGEIHEGKWRMNVDGVMKEIGLGILRNYKDDPIAEEDFVEKWKAAVGDSFEFAITITLLSGNYLASQSPTDDTNILKYFPASSLPVDPAARFGDLFLTRARWKANEINPFLDDIALNAKERDKLLLRFARSSTDSQNQVWYTARAKYNG